MSEIRLKKIIYFQNEISHINSVSLLDDIAIKKEGDSLFATGIIKIEIDSGIEVVKEILTVDVIFPNHYEDAKITIKDFNYLIENHQVVLEVILEAHNGNIRVEEENQIFPLDEIISTIIAKQENLNKDYAFIEVANPPQATIDIETDKQILSFLESELVPVDEEESSCYNDIDYSVDAEIEELVKELDLIDNKEVDDELELVEGFDCKIDIRDELAKELDFINSADVEGELELIEDFDCTIDMRDELIRELDLINGEEVDDELELIEGFNYKVDKQDELVRELDLINNETIENKLELISDLKDAEEEPEITAVSTSDNVNNEVVNLKITEQNQNRDDNFEALFKFTEGSPICWKMHFIKDEAMQKTILDNTKLDSSENYGVKINNIFIVKD